MHIAAYCAQRYAEYLERRPNEEWLGKYVAFCNRTAEVGRYLNEHPPQQDEDKKVAVMAALGALGEKPDDYLEEAWYARENGIAKIQQGGPSREDFVKLREDAQFWPSFEQALRLAGQEPSEESMISAYDSMALWMEEFTRKNVGTRRFLAFVNRFFAACLPGRVSSIAAPNRLNKLLSHLNAWDAYDEFRGNSAGSWLSQNRFLFEVLARGLDGRAQQGDTPYQRSIFFWWLLENIVTDDAGQLILFGSPGTGKTHMAKETAEHGIAGWCRLHPDHEEGDQQIIQFHPSYTYEDFIEGIRPSSIVDGTIQLALVPGIFKRFCRKAAKWELAFWKQTGTALTETTTIGELPLDRDASVWGFLDHHPLDDSIVVHLPPFYFIIDEINRAELSRVLGETMMTLEYRGIKNKIRSQYSSLVSSPDHSAAFLFDGGADYFFVPYNVRLIGTMNVIDRSVESFDFALRRRFRWKELTFDKLAMHAILSEKSLADVKLAEDRFIALNKRIAQHPLLGHDYQIGHAYAKRLIEYNGPGGMREALRFLWRNHLEALLHEYLRGLGRGGLIEEAIQSLRGEFPD